jgi:serine/threonine protein kinase
MQQATGSHPLVPVNETEQHGDRHNLATVINGPAKERWNLDTVIAAAPSVDAPMGLLPNTRVGKYRIEREIGRGGQGCVFLAEDEDLQRHVALKTTGQAPIGNEDWLRRFHYESRALASLQHPNIVQVYEAFQEENAPFFAMEYVDGMSLDMLIRDKGQSRRELVDIVAKCCDAIACAHKAGIIHRDLKPQNVLVGTDGVPKVTDFGLATALSDNEKNPGATTEGRILGSPSYMAPEQAQGLQYKIGPHTDVYGLGAILYEVLTGHPPFEGEGAMSILMRIVKEDPLPPRALDSTVDRDLGAICMKALEKDSAARYASAREMAADLRRYLNNELVLARPASIGTHIRKAIRRNKELAILGSVAMIFVVVALAVSISLFVKQSASSAKEGLRTEARSVASTAAVMFLAEEVNDVRVAGDTEKESFKAMVARMNKLRARNLRIREVYLLRKQEGGKGFVVVADADSFLQARENQPGVAFFNGDAKVITSGLRKGTADAHMVKRHGSKTLSGYAPVLSEDGKTVAVLGLDLCGDSVDTMMQPVLHTTAQVSGLAALLFMALTSTVSIRVLRKRRRRLAGLHSPA